MILSFLQRYLTTVLAFVTASALASAGVQTLRISGLKLEAAKTAQKAATARAEQEATVRTASENFRRTEADLRSRVDSAQGKYDELQKTHTAIIAAHRASDDRMRGQLAAYARGSSAPGNTCTAERERAEALGLLLADGLRLQDQLAADAESASDSVRALKSAWPK